MKWHLLLPLFVYTWLVGGCQALAGSESSVAITLEATKSAQPLITATSRPATRVPPTPTPDIAATVVALSPPRIHSSFPSADGKWRAEVLIYDCVKVDARESADANAVELLRLIRLSDQTETVVETALLNCGCGGAHGIGGLFWSANDRYFYYTDARESARDGLCGYWARPIKRVDVDHQDVELVGG